MALNTPKRIRTLASLASSPPNSEYGSPPWHTTNSPNSTCGSPEFVVNQQVSEKNENRRGRPRSEALTTLMIEGSSSPSSIKCGFCNRVFPREKSLQAHLRTHTDPLKRQKLLHSNSTMAGHKKRKDEDSSSISSDSDDEVLSKKITKENVGKKNWGRSNNKRSSSGKTKANVTSDEESDAEHDANDPESEEKVAQKTKGTNGKRATGRSNKNLGDSASRPIRNAETSKESSKKRTETTKDESSEESSQENDQSNASANHQNGSRTKRSHKKRERKPRKKDPPKKNKEEEYEVEKIIDFKIEDKIKFFLVRWKGYDSGSDSWVAHRDLHCTVLITKFYEQRPEASVTTQKRRKKVDFSRVPKKQKKPARQYPRPLKIDEQPDYDSEAFDENQEWKVEKIVDVRYHRGNKRDFLIHWEGFSSRSDSWEPEENLDCKELIKKFTAKLDVLVSATEKELRPVRKPTQRYTVMDAAKGRRLSKRFDGRQRASYYDCEE